MNDIRGAAELTLRTDSYTYADLPLTAESQGYAFEALTIDRGGKVFSPPIGAPITFANLGLLTVEGRVLLNAEGKPAEVRLHAKGGLANWWRASYRCTITN